MTHTHTDRIVHITEGDYSKVVEGSERPVLVDFWAPWCPPCVALAPTLDALAEEFEGRAVIAKVNIDEQPELARQHQVRSIPTMLFYRDGALVDRKLGNASKGELRGTLETLVNE